MALGRRLNSVEISAEVHIVQLDWDDGRECESKDSTALSKMSGFPNSLAFLLTRPESLHSKYHHRLLFMLHIYWSHSLLGHA